MCKFANGRNVWRICNIANGKKNIMKIKTSLFFFNLWVFELFGGSANKIVKK